ncbi:MAG: TonB-dependent receptor [Micropepsaceae bacterium]
MAKVSGVRAVARNRMARLAVAGIAGLAMGSTALSQVKPAEEPADKDEIVAAAETSGSETIDVKGKRKELESPKYTAPILDTPQTITVIDSGTIRGQNLLTLREILSTAPGITFGAGEGGGGYGDSINLRGYAANSDITVDGVRDSAQYTRTDPFNLEQLELVNGANSVYGGSGSLGGSINIVTKTPHGRNETTVTGAIGTDNYYRGTVDADYVIADGIAFRLNLMAHENDVPGRDVEKYSRFGIAPSVVFGLNSDTQLTLSYVHQEDDNIPQYGVPYFRNAFNDGALPGASSSNYYGYSNVDRQEIQVDQFTATINHEFNDWLSVRNLTRYQEVTQLSIVDPPQGTFCLASGINPATGAACASPNTYIPSGPRGNTRDTKNTLFYNQTDFAMEFMTGGIQHNAVVGFSFSSEDYHLDTGSSLRNANGTYPNGAALPAGYVFPTMGISDPDHVWTGPVNFLRTGASDGTLGSRAFYAFDTMTISPQFELNFGLRYETIEGEFTAAALPTTPANTPGVNIPPYTSLRPTLAQGQIFYNEESILSYRFGAVYKPVANASIYIAYGNTETPSQATVNGGCSLATCDVDPERGEIFEIGAKWSVFENRLLLSASIFQNDRTNYRVASNETGVPDQQLDGSARVRGLTLSATGNMTKELTVFANYTYLDTEVIQGVSEYCVANPLVPACATALAANNGVAGNPLLNTPEHSGSFWLTYALPAGFTVGYGVSYQGSFYLNNGIGTLYKSDDYWVHSAMVSYQATEQALIQLNVKNLTDEDYFIRIRNNGWATPGDGLQATLSASYTF